MVSQYLRAERENATLQAIMRISANMFQEKGVTADAVAAAVTNFMAVFGIDPESETPGSLDAVEVAWWTREGMTPLATLRQLAEMCEDVTETDAESGEVTVTAPKKIKALGVYDFDAECDSHMSYLS